MQPAPPSLQILRPLRTQSNCARGASGPRNCNVAHRKCKRPPGFWTVAPRVGRRACRLHARGWIRSRRRRGARCPLIWAASLLARTPLAPMQPSATPERAPGAHRGWCSPDAPERLAAFHELYHPLALHMRADTAANCSRTAAPPATASSDERDPALVHAIASLGQAQLVIMGFRRSATLQLHFQLAFAPCRAPARQLSTPLTHTYAGCSAARC